MEQLGRRYDALAGAALARKLQQALREYRAARRRLRFRLASVADAARHQCRQQR
jgi:hypothetical protein